MRGAVSAWGEHPIVPPRFICDFCDVGKMLTGTCRKPAIFKATGTNMTRLQFERARTAIEQETFQSTACDPMTYGITRNNYLCQKYKRLIALAEETPGETARNKLKQWKRQLERSVAAKDRFEKLRAEIKLHPPINLFTVVASEPQP